MLSNVCPGCKTALEINNAKFCSKCGYKLGNSLHGQNSSFAPKPAQRTVHRRYRHSRLPRWFVGVLETRRKTCLVARMWLRENLEWCSFWIVVAVVAAAFGFAHLGWTIAMGFSLSLLLWLPILWIWSKPRLLKDRSSVGPPSVSLTEAKKDNVNSSKDHSGTDGMPLNQKHPEPKSPKVAKGEEAQWAWWMLIVFCVLAMATTRTAKQKEQSRHDSRRSNFPRTTSPFIDRMKVPRIKQPQPTARSQITAQATAQATANYWLATVVEFHEMRFGDPANTNSLENKTWSENMAEFQAKIDRAQSLSTEGVDPLLVEMCRRHLMMDESWLRLAVQTDRWATDAGADAAEGTSIQQDVEDFEKILNEISEMSDEEFERLPENFKYFINEVLIYLENNEARLLDIVKMQTVLSERYGSKGISFPLPSTSGPRPLKVN